MTAGTNPAAASRIVLYLSESGLLIAKRLSSLTLPVKGADIEAILETYQEVIFVTAVPIAVRLIAPHIKDKATDPAVVSVDEYGKFAVPLLSGHRGANLLARSISQSIGATAVITTLSDISGTCALDSIPGYSAVGAVAKVQNAINHGGAPSLINEHGWPLPATLLVGDDETTIVVSDSAPDIDTISSTGVVQLIPSSLTVGVGCSLDCSSEELTELLQTGIRLAGLSSDAIAAIATIDIRADHPAVRSLGIPILAFSSEELASIEVPNPSEVVQRTVGTASVAEAASLLGAGPDSTLVLAKIKSPMATLAIARRSPQRGELRVVGIGPGSPGMRTMDAQSAILSSQVIIGFGPYIDLIDDLLGPSQEVHRYPIGEESDRVRHAISSARSGYDTALVCSGDPGVYAMAALTFEEADTAGFDSTRIRIVPGVTAALAAAGLAGAPLGHDHVYISLSDLLTPWDAIERRIAAAAEADLVVAFYNPRSKQRTDQLSRALDILAGFRSPNTPVILAKKVGRKSQQVTNTTLAAVEQSTVDMETLVIVGNTSTKFSGSRVYTPRGYHLKT